MNASSHGFSQSVLSINLRWLMRLRWLAALAFAVLLFCNHYFFGFVLPLVPLVGILVLLMATNLFVGTLMIDRSNSHTSLMGGLLLLDVVFLTLILFLTGGPANPFSIFYLVHITLAAFLLSAFWSWFLAGCSIVFYGLLFLVSPFSHTHLHGGSMHDTTGHDSSGGFSLHLKGMWLAFSLAAFLVAYFVSGLLQALKKKDLELQTIRDRQEKNRRLLSLATLSAGAAHELATPLATIAVVTKEIEQELADCNFSKIPEGEGITQDLCIIRSQINRCREIIDLMAGNSEFEEADAALGLNLEEFFAEISQGFVSKGNLSRIQFQNETSLDQIFLPKKKMERILFNLIKNSLDASPENQKVTVRVSCQSGYWRFLVLDHGTGMKQEIFERIFEPFFTTKDTGKGFGLGLFLTKSLVEEMGGRLSIQSQWGLGTQSLVELPM